MKKRLPLYKALLIIVGSMTCVGLVGKASLDFYLARKIKGEQGDTKCIYELYQSSGTTERLSTSYLSETLGLSSDKPTSLRVFDTKKAQQRLLQSPMIRYAHVSKKHTNGLTVRYHMRKPFMAFGDIYNAAVDEEGRVFPMRPYYAPKKLPTMYLGQVPSAFGESIQGELFDTVKTIYTSLHQYKITEVCSIEAIDVSMLAETSLGKKGIVLVLTNPYGRHYLRLHHKHYEQSIANYKEMLGDVLIQEKEAFEKAPVTKIIDLRIPGYAYVDESM